MFGVDNNCAECFTWNIPETGNSHIGNLRPLSDVAGARVSASKLSGAKNPFDDSVCCHNPAGTLDSIARIGR